MIHTRSIMIMEEWFKTNSNQSGTNASTTVHNDLITNSNEPGANPSTGAKDKSNKQIPSQALLVLLLCSYYS